MKSSTKDTLEATGHKVKGTFKESFGKISNNPDLEAEGAVEKAAGHVQAKSGEVKKAFKK